MRVTKQKNSTSFWKKTWVASIGVFILSQLLFKTLETTGWIPNLKEIDGTVWGKIDQMHLFNKFFGFYETPHFNIMTGFLVITCLIPGIIGGIKDFFATTNGKRSKLMS